MHTARATLDVARHAAGLALQVEAQAHGVQMAEHLQRQTARRTLGGLCKHQFAQLGKQRGGQAQRAIPDQQRHRHHQDGGRVTGLDGHGIDQILEQQGHTHIGHLGSHHEAQSGHHPPFVGPEVREQARQRFPVGVGFDRFGAGDG